MTSSCPHFQNTPYAQIGVNTKDDPLLLSLRSKIDSGKSCQICKKPTKTVHLCLNPDCSFVGCGRDDRRHALEHYKAKHRGDKDSHCVVLNCRALQCWCYECDADVVPEMLALLDREEADSVRSSVASSTLTVPRNKVMRAPTTLAIPAGCVGLYNLGNSCYMNAAMQALLNCQPFLGFFQRCGAFIYRHSHRRISEHFHRLVDMIHTSNMQAISPNRLVREVKLVNPMFHGYTQQDTMDFVRCILDRIHEEIKVPVHRRPSEGPATEHGSSSDPASGSPDQRRRSERVSKHHQRPLSTGKQKEFPQYQSIVSETFGGVLRSEIDCLKCRNLSVKDDLFYDVSIPICASPEGTKGSKSSLGYLGNLLSSFGETIGLNGKPVKLETCLAAFCAPETLDGKDRYKCEKCNELVQSKKSLRFRQLPQIFCIQLKRFRHESYFSSKIGTHVIFPVQQLEMRPFLHEAVADECTHSRYHLTAVISHRGTFSGGHYIAYCRGPEAEQWLEFDDANVNIISEEELTKVQAYVLFYSLIDGGACKDRDQWRVRIAACNPEREESVFISRNWYNKWLTMVKPGPLDNSEVQCQHGCLTPEKLVDPVELVQVVPKDVYACLAELHGECSGLEPLREAIACEKCIEEERQMDERRRQEEKDIQALDTSTIRPGEHWYLICANWLVRWGQFKSGAGPPPGPISNDRLVVEGQPRPNLVRGTHYRGVNRRVWGYFHRIYGGGPTIIRRSINVYSPPVPPSSAGECAESPADEVYVDVEGH